MAVSKVIRGEPDDVIRWELPEVGERHDEVDDEPPVLTAAQVEELQRAAYDEAFEQGRKEGFAQGHEEGHEEGHKQGVEEGHKQGLEQGHAEGYAAGEQEGRELVARIGEVLTALAAPLAQLDDEVEQQLLALVLALSKQIIRRELQTQPGEIMAVVREAIELLPINSRSVKVHVHPDDAAFLRENMGEGAEESWKLHEDPAMSRGGCHVVSASSRIDSSLERRLAMVACDLLGGEREEDEPVEAADER